jgi:hypothetical protein
VPCMQVIDGGREAEMAKKSKKSKKGKKGKK